MRCFVMGIEAWQGGMSGFASKVFLIQTKILVWALLLKSSVFMAVYPSPPHSLPPVHCCCHPSASYIAQPGRGKHPYL